MSSNLKYLFFLSLVLCCSCGENSNAIPIEAPVLIKILCDVHVVEGALQYQKSTQKDSIAKAYYDQIYQKYDIEESDFITTLKVIEKDPKLLEELYAKVLIELDSLEERSYKRKYKKK